MVQMVKRKNIKIRLAQEDLDMEDLPGGAHNL